MLALRPVLPSSRGAWLLHAVVLVGLVAIGLAISRRDPGLLGGVAFWIAFAIHAPTSSVMTAHVLRKLGRAWSPPHYRRLLPVIVGQFAGALTVAVTCLAGTLLATLVP
jgi:hypothetical protein